jgi:hypothetical protein
VKAAVERAGPDYLTHPAGGWPVERCTVLAVYDPDSAFFDLETIGRWIREGMAREHMADFGDVVVAEDETFDGGYANAPWPGHGPHTWSDYGEACDCGPELPDNWMDQVKPLVMVSTLCRECGGVPPECTHTDALG